MAKINVKVKQQPIYTHEGGKAVHINPEQQLKRSVMSCMLWEDEFYESGEAISKRIAKFIPLVKPEKVAQIANDARNKSHLRHVPLFIAREMARLFGYRNYVKDILAEVIQRPDELTEFLAIYWKEKRQPLSAQVKKGLSAAFGKFNEYQLAKYNRADKIKLKDVLKLVHPKPRDEAQAKLWERLKNDNLVVPDTWEVELSKQDGKTKKEKWERLLIENKLGGMALLRNLRNFKENNVDKKLVFACLAKMKADKILPFRFITAAKYAPQWESMIEPIMIKCISGEEKLKGKTMLVVDGSGSMFGSTISSKSEINRFEAASALAILLMEVCEECSVIIYSNSPHLIPSRKGFALRDALFSKAEKGGTNTEDALQLAAEEGYDRIIVITDEQSHQNVQTLIDGAKGYFINIASAQNGIGYGKWVHIDGFSEAVVNYIREYEKAENNQ
jgi:60 kDa SS-A/Ro ribonucleoprotein